MRTSQKTAGIITTIGIDLGKNTFHLVGFDQRGVIILQQKVSRGQLERGACRAAKRATWSGTEPFAPALGFEYRSHRTVDRRAPKDVSFPEPKSAVAGFAKARRVRKDGLENGL